VPSLKLTAAILQVRYSRLYLPWVAGVRASAINTAARSQILTSKGANEMKYQPGEYIPIDWGERPDELFVMGHIDPAEARNVIEAEEGDTYEFADPVPYYGAWLVGKNEDGGCCQQFWPFDKPGRGRFKVMMARVIR
jgi:hypothetical protein